MSGYFIKMSGLGLCCKYLAPVYMEYLYLFLLQVTPIKSGNSGIKKNKFEHMSVNIFCFIICIHEQGNIIHCINTECLTCLNCV